MPSVFRYDEVRTAFFEFDVPVFVLSFENKYHLSTKETDDFITIWVHFPTGPIGLE